MKKIKWKDIRIRRIQPHELTDRLLLLNVYLTQAITVVIGIVILLFQSQHVADLFRFPADVMVWVWAAAAAAMILAADLLLGRWVPDDVTDDGGINDMLFRNLPLWHIALLSLVVAICEEMLFRGAIQHAFGPYWTSILFAAVHVRYLRHWLMTGVVFGSSYILGKLYVMTGTLWAPIAAHFLIDFVLGCLIRYRRGEGDVSEG